MPSHTVATQCNSASVTEKPVRERRERERERERERRRKIVLVAHRAEGIAPALSTTLLHCGWSLAEQHVAL